MTVPAAGRTHAGTRALPLGRRALVGLLRGYKMLISPWLPPACRFQPTCSVYAIEAVELHGVWRGGGLALRRLLRCNPFSRGGFDPVPPALSSSK